MTNNHEPLPWSVHWQYWRFLLDRKLLTWFGYTQDCGCQRLLRSRRIYCWDHAMQRLDNRHGTDPGD